MVIITAQLHSTKSELRFCASLNPAHAISEIYDCLNLWQWPWLKIKHKCNNNSSSLSSSPFTKFCGILILGYQVLNTTKVTPTPRKCIALQHCFLYIFLLILWRTSCGEKPITKFYVAFNHFSRSSKATKF